MMCRIGIIVLVVPLRPWMLQGVNYDCNSMVHGRLGVVFNLAVCRIGIAEVGHHSQVAISRGSQNEWVLHLCKSAASAHRLLATENLSSSVRS